MSNIVLGLDFKVIAHSVGVGVSLGSPRPRPYDGVDVYLVRFYYRNPDTFHVTTGVFSPGMSHVTEDLSSCIHAMGHPESLTRALGWVQGEPPTCDVPIPPDVLQETLRILQCMGDVQKQQEQEQEEQERQWLQAEIDERLQEEDERRQEEDESNE